ncbi:MAG: hypothetical protein F4139_08265 [Gemmatimonadetes bacterium]|nr:hypothetical protein [Gemmatimonadota bacterium]MYH52931.1 hypothetical protein [Gemmatimonadota bacterium]MYK67790.1 hypothetical protein [Gemmatimonadota bacterium]
MLVVVLALGCGADSGDDASDLERTFAPERIGTAQVPPSADGDVALLSGETIACVINSYEVQVRCVDRSGAVVGTFGREGEGPGEFESLSDVLGGPDGTVGALDIGNDRFGVYQPSGTLLTEVPLPGAAVGLSPIRRFAETLAGVSITVFDPVAMQAGAGPGGFLTLFEVDIASAELVREEEVPPVDAEVECGRILYGFPNPGGGWVFIACEGHLVFVGVGGEPTVVRAPAYTGELPNDRDVAERIEGMSFLASAGIPFDQERLDRYRNTPKNYHLLLGEQIFDEQGRLWIATQRDRDEYSYLDVYVPGDAAFLGTVRVDDRIMGFDLLGSTLVVVVERQLSPENPDGIPERAVDWYDLSEWR